MIDLKEFGITVDQRGHDQESHGPNDQRDAEPVRNEQGCGAQANFGHGLRDQAGEASKSHYRMKPPLHFFVSTDPFLLYVRLRLVQERIRQIFQA